MRPWARDKHYFLPACGTNTMTCSRQEEPVATPFALKLSGREIENEISKLAPTIRPAKLHVPDPRSSVQLRIRLKEQELYAVSNVRPFRTLRRYRHPKLTFCGTLRTISGPNHRYAE